MSESTSFIRIFVGVLLSATAAGVFTSCPIELSPPSVVVRYGDSVSVNCSTSESLFDGIGWEASQGGKSLESVTHMAWTVEKLTEWTISPSCYINPFPESSFQQCLKNPKVVLYTFPENISLSSSSGPLMEMSEGEKHNFTCDIQNIAPVINLTVKWYKGDEMVYEDTFKDPSKEPVNQSSIFSFIPTRQDNRVTFRCEAHLDLRPEGPQLNASSQEYNITVFFGPEVQCAAVLEGETLERRCSVMGYPIPTVTWSKNGTSIEPTEPLSRENAGMYFAVAEGAESTTTEHWIVVWYKPELKCPSNYTALEDAPHNLSCTVEGFPKPEVMWFKDEDEVALPESLTRSDTGQYVISASNNLSSINVTVEINVVYPPSQIVELEDSEVDVGSDVWLKCSSTGNPRPNYLWDYYQTANVVEENEDGVSRLHIHNATVYNKGSYTCHAWNDRGNVSKTATVTVKGAGQECPIEITPERMVVQYQDREQRATCNATSTDHPHAKEIYWQVLHGDKIDSSSWSVDTYKDWDPKPVCTAIFNVRGMCQKHLNFTLYKTPDNVSVSTVDNLSSVVDDKEFQLQCDITNVAPAGNLVVQWYRGNTTLPKGSLRVSGCLPENNTNCDIKTVRSPLNVSSTISFTLNRNDKSAEFRCEAILDLGAEGPKPRPNMMSSPLNITVYYKPSINTTKLPKRIPVFRGYPEELVCEAEGHPPPEIEWLYSEDKVPHKSGDTLIVYEAGRYTCNATNEVDSTYHAVEVILKGKPVSSSCEIEFSPPKVVVRFGDPFSLNCISTSNQIDSMGWEAIYGTGTGLQDGVSSVALKIDSVKDWKMEPQCFVNLENGVQCSETLNFTVYKMPDFISQPSQMDPMVEGEKYRLQCDIVDVAPIRHLFVVWHIGNTIIYKDSFNDDTTFPVNTSSVLNLTAQRGYNGAQVWCEANMLFSPPVQSLPKIQSKPQKLIVLYSPTFTKPENETFELSARNKIMLNCTATGNPMPVYSWGFAHPIQQTKKNDSQLILTPSIRLPGTYNCTASNTQGSSTKYFTVIEAPRNRTTFAALVGGFVFLGAVLFIGGLLFVKPDGTFSFSKLPTLLSETHFSCLKSVSCTKADSNPVPCRVAKLVQVGICFSLSPLNRRLSAQDNMGITFFRWILTLCMIYSVSGEGCSLVLKPSRVVVGFGEPVSVSCEATRPVRVLGWESVISAAHTQQDLSVQWKVDSLIDWIEEPICYGVFFTAPRQCEEKLNLVLYKTPDSVSIRPVNHSGPMVEGKEYQLLCEVQNIAPVQYLTLRWYKGQTEVYNHSFTELTSSSPVQVSSILMVTPTKAENGAQYRCVAELELGPEGPQPPPTVTSEPLNASVYFPPTFLDPVPAVLDLTVGAEMTLNCTATGNPMPVYSWQSSNPIPERMGDEAALTSSSLLPGTYTCTASNTLEKKSKQFIIKAKTKGV
ncbi:hemicentin-1-like [Gymnodraco acuticeps]|uniref:Hemicentin-1-like n=1 Tax=Gymnodraco acuticeps TaxID=8218 RepID=A0A6P8UFL5_GYMAC|nr:hemicentin-1-like [Gymnodraco acuticeps]